MDETDRENSLYSTVPIVFVIAYTSSPHSGDVRPFINWAKWFHKKGHDYIIIVYKSSSKISKELDKLQLNYKVAKNKSDIKNLIQYKDYKYIIIDDYLKRLQLINEIKHKTIVYAQILFGLHAISPLFDLTGLTLKLKILYKFFKNFPFSLFSSWYREQLNSVPLILANSEFTATLQYVLYGIMPFDIIYPPVDTTIFRPKTRRKEDFILIYAGSNAGDTNYETIKRICQAINGMNIIFFGNEKLLPPKSLCKYEYISGIPDEELAILYSKAQLTVAPQMWETFGYVTAESIACCTPALVFKGTASAEIIKITKYGITVKNVNNMIEVLKNFNKYTRDLNCNIDIDALPFSIKSSSENLLQAIMNISSRHDARQLPNP